MKKFGNDTKPPIPRLERAIALNLNSIDDGTALVAENDINSTEVPLVAEISKVQTLIDQYESTGTIKMKEEEEMKAKPPVVRQKSVKFLENVKKYLK
jgi:hypothetical protein